MKIAAVTMVKDEAEIIEYTLAYMASEVDEIIVADNLSSDETVEVLASLNLPCSLVLTNDDEVGYYQSRKMTDLAFLAKERGADWVIPFDADEIWRSSDGSIREALSRVVSPVAGFSLYNYFPCPGDDQEARNPFQRIYHRDASPAPLPKVAVRPVPGLVIEQGNHGASINGRKVPDPRSGLRADPPIVGVVRHFPWRSFEQFELKVRNGAAAYQATDLPEEMGSHWRGYGRVLDELGPEGLRTGIWERWFYNPDGVDLVYDPVNPL